MVGGAQQTGHVAGGSIAPASQSYSSAVTLLRRGTFDRSALAARTPSEIEAWLLEDALASRDLLDFYQKFVWRMDAAGMQVVRSSLHVGTLHPQLYGYAWNWNIDDGLCDEVTADTRVLTSDAYRRPPPYSG